MHLTALAAAARVAVVVAIALAASARPAAAARASDAEDAYAAALTRAIAAKERALDVNEPPRWEEALRLFQEAASIRYTRECAYEIGVAAEHLSRNDLPVEGYEAALDLGLVGPARARAQAFVAAHASGMARLMVRGPAGRVVSVAGVHRGRLPLQRPIVLFPGEVRLDILDASNTVTSVTVRLRGGQAEAVDLDKEAVAAKPPSADSPPPPAPVVTPRPSESDPARLPPPPPAAAAPSAMSPTPAANPEPPGRAEVDVSSRGLWIAGIGAVVGVAAAVLWPVSQSRINSERSTLADNCIDPVVNDACTALPGHGAAGQTASDSIATWKAVRIGAAVGVGVGVVAVAGGLLLRYRDGMDAATASPRPALVLEQEGGRLRLGLAWTLQF